MSWNRLAPIEAQDLKEARLNLHYASQVVSGVGRSLLPSQDDDSHTNLEWIEREGGLACHPVEGDKPFRLLLDFERFRLSLQDLEGQALFDTALAGKTLDQAYSWLADGIASRLGQKFTDIKRPAYDMPEHAVGRSGAFSFEPAAAFAEWRRWYSNAASALEEVSREHSGSPVRCWPHHFDIATLIKLGESKSVGVGLSPGDGSYDEPYWYVGPYPHPSPEQWPALEGGGHWHTEGFVAAVLTGGDFVSNNDQPKRLQQFLTSALSASKKLLA